MHVAGGDPLLAGHFPGRPIFPGVLLVEALAQAGAIAVLADERYRGSLPLLGGVDRARFRRQVVPGDDCDLVVEMVTRSTRAGRARGTARVRGRPVADVDLLFVITPP